MEETTTKAYVFKDLLTTQQIIDFMETSSIVYIVMCFFGLHANVVNIKTFISMGLTDGVISSFTALSFCDLAFLITMLGRGIFIKLFTIEVETSYIVWFYLEPSGISLFFANVGITLYVNTILITTFLAVARCMCVARPLHFRNTFTIKRSVWILVVFLLFSILSSMPVLVNMRMVKLFDSKVNDTRVLLWLSPSRYLAKAVVGGIRDTFLIIFTQIIVIFSVLIMAHSLKAASEFRKQAALQSRPHGEDNQKSSAAKSDKVDTDATHVSRRRKDLQVIQQVALISVVYIVCNTPNILIAISVIIEPELNLFRDYGNTYVAVMTIVEIFKMVNSSTNFFVYYMYNSKFRSCCHL